MLTFQIKRALLNKARRIAPADTWNLRLNGMYGRNMLNPNLFTIRYDGGRADYIEYLEDYDMAGGSVTKTNKHKGFIRMTAHILASDLESYFNAGGKKPKMRRFSREQYSEMNNARNMRFERSMRRTNTRGE